ncbi:hypothetical protein HGO23_13130 [Xenorhabdus budapestensis]|uniref:GNAT family N-acetyltransferase n=1 Tax=Xenorhabdus budapestensis TaxID=290110 RepID=A0ABX7VG70_XENBU|nr:hypothetical protein [Xenorhabdus budapestensis]QTL38817.1 hypothetical protein HGO23_13130 [Xenorhabdus budapestensis]
MIIRTASMQDLDAISSLYNILFSEMAALQPDRLRDVEQDKEFIISSMNAIKFKIIIKNK